MEFEEYKGIIIIIKGEESRKNVDGIPRIVQPFVYGKKGLAPAIGYFSKSVISDEEKCLIALCGRIVPSYFLPAYRSMRLLEAIEEMKDSDRGGAYNLFLRNSPWYDDFKWKKGKYKFPEEEVDLIKRAGLDTVNKILNQEPPEDLEEILKKINKYGIQINESEIEYRERMEIKPKHLSQNIIQWLRGEY